MTPPSAVESVLSILGSNRAKARRAAQREARGSTHSDAMLKALALALAIAATAQVRMQAAATVLSTRRAPGASSEQRAARPGLVRRSLGLPTDRFARRYRRRPASLTSTTRARSASKQAGAGRRPRTNAAPSRTRSARLLTRRPLRRTTAPSWNWTTRASRSTSSARTSSLLSSLRRGVGTVRSSNPRTPTRPSG